MRRVRMTVLLTAISAGCLIAVPSQAARAPVTGQPPGHHRDGIVERDLVSDIPGRAEVTDPNLVNPWGRSAAPGGPIWVSDNGSNKATGYAGARPGQPVRIVPTVVSIPGQGAPTGQVFNDTNGFRIGTDRKGRTAPARYIFAGENGQIFAWNPEVSPTSAVQTANVRDAVYKGLALTRNGHGEPRLLAANFHDARIDVFDERFHRIPQRGRFQKFQDSEIPAGFAPFNVAVIGRSVFVTYAKQDAQKHDDVAGPGNGFITEFNSDGRLLRRFARRGVLNSPWGMIVAPADFGKFSRQLLVGNFGDGRINVFDPRTGRSEGPLTRPDGSPIVIDGLWGLQRGTAVAGGRDQVWFAAGIQDEAHGLLGTLRASNR